MKTFVAVIAVIHALIFAAGFVVIARNEYAYKNVVANVCVVSGQTLWGICERLAKTYGDERDIRTIVYSAEKDLGGCALYPGQKLQIVLRVKK